MDLMSPTEGIKERFQTTERIRDLLRKWEASSLEGVMKASRDKRPFSMPGIVDFQGD